MDDHELDVEEYGVVVQIAEYDSRNSFFALEGNNWVYYPHRSLRLLRSSISLKIVSRLDVDGNDV